MRLVLMCALVVFGVHRLSAQSTLTVPGQFPTIQAAIAAAVHGDTVLVSPGTYGGPITFSGTRVHLLSVAGPNATTIIGGGGIPTITMSGCNPVGTQPTIEGFTIAGGAPGLLLNTTATVTNCIFMTCFATATGGVAAIHQPVLTSSDCGGQSTVIRGCAFVGSYGDEAILKFTSNLPNAPVLIEESTFENCVTNVFSANFDLESVVRFDPLSQPSTMTVQDCVFRNNEATGVRGATTVRRCRFDNNFVGVYADTISHSLIVGNEYRGATCATVTASTIVGNGSPYLVGGWGLFASAARNTLIASNVPADLGSILGLPSGTSLDHCLVGFSTLPLSGIGLIVGPPLFVPTSTSDYRLAPNSPARNAGSNVYATEPFDFDGLPRISGGTVDIGAFEVPDALFPSTNEPLALYAWTNGTGNPHASVRPVAPGDLETFLFISPGGALNGTMPLIAAQFFPDWLPPTAPILPGLWLDAGAFIVYGGLPTTPFFFGLPAAGVSGSWSVPPGLQGLRLRIQGFVSTPFAANGLFASTNAVELDF